MDDVNNSAVADPVVKKSGKFDGAHFVTVDSASTRDIDDAFFISKTEDGYRLLVMIADPTPLVLPGTPEDQQARLLGSTVYVRDKAVKKMLPSHISEHEGSLIADRYRRVFAMDMLLGEDMELKAFEISRTRISVGARLSYEDIPGILQIEQHPLREMLGMAAQVARMLMQKRRSKGALALYDLSRLLMTDEEGRLVQLHRADEVIGHIIIQEFMVLTNTVVAGWMITHDVPGIFRNHQSSSAAPPQDELASLIEGWMKSGMMDNESVQAQFSLICGRASYSNVVKGHFALAVGCYGHFTSPLRRYADLVNMRQIRAHLKGDPFPYSPEELGPLAEELNVAADKRKAERSEGFKAVVRKTAGQALESQEMARLADHELVQAIKMAAVEDVLPSVLTEELSSRLGAGIASDKVVQCLVFQVDHAKWDETLRDAFSLWLKSTPTRAMALLNHGAQLGVLKALSVESDGSGTAFAGQVSFSLVDGSRLHASGTAARKREAEQLAATAAFLGYLGIGDLQYPAPLTTPSSAIPVTAAAPAAVGNPKGALLEICQKKTWPMPTFEASWTGPDNARTFACVVKMTVKGQLMTAKSDGAATKKNAEAMASQSMLAQLKGINVR